MILYALEISAFLLLGCYLAWRVRWAYRVPLDELPEILRKNHDDWWLLSKVPRRLTAWVPRKGVAWKPPVQVIGNVPKGAHLDIVPNGCIAVCLPPYLTWRWSAKRSFRLGFRPDYFDNYYTLAFSPFDKVD